MTKKLICFTSVAFLAVWLGTPEARAGSAWTNLSSGMNATVWSLAYDTNGNLYAGGDFTNAGGKAANRIAKWNGSFWTNLGNGMGGPVYALAHGTNGNLYAGGNFTNIGNMAANRIAQWNASTGWTNLSNGMNATVWSLAYDTNGNLYAGGDFTTAGGVAANRIAQWNESTGWTNLSNGMNATVWSLACDTNGNLYAGGDFTTADGRPATNVAKWNASAGGWTNLGSGMNATLWSLACGTNGNLYAGGDFTTAGGVAATNIAQWNESTGWTNLGSGMGGAVYALARGTNGNLYAGGDFTNAGGGAATNVAKWNGSSWTNLGSGMNATIWSLACGTNGNPYAGGSFTNAGGVAANRIAKWTEWTEGWIGIVPATLDYTATNSVGNPATQTFVVTNAGQTAFNFSNTVSYSAGASNWFVPSVTTGLVSADGSLTVTGSVINITSLNVGMYYATNTFTANADNSPQTLVVTLRVLSGNEGHIVIPATLDYTATNGAGDPVTQTFVVENSGQTAFNFSNTLSYSANSGTNWFTPSPTTGRVLAAHSRTVVGSVYITNLNADVYYATNTFTASEADNSPQQMVVTLRVLDPARARLWVSPTNLTNAATVGQVPAGDVFQVANTGAAPRGTMTYTVTTTNSWLSVNKPSGEVIDNTDTVIVTYATAELTNAGWYTGRVDVVALGEGVGSQAVDVVLRVNNRPGVAWDATNSDKVWTNEVILGNSLAGTNVAVWNGSGEPAGQMRYRIYVNDPSGFGWASVSPDIGTNTGTGTVTYTTAGLAAGEYTAQLMVEGWDVATDEPATNGPLSVGLKLTVKGSGPVLKTDVTNLSLTVLQNHPGNNSFWVWNEGMWPRGGMSYTVTSAVSWVSVSNASGVVTNDAAEIQVQWNTNSPGLGPGTNLGNLWVNAWDANSGPGTPATGSPTNIPLTLIVTPRTPTNLELPMVVGTLYVGQTVTNYPGLWNNQGRLHFTYQWNRASDKTGGGQTNLPGATGSTYVIMNSVTYIGTNSVTNSDLGKYLQVAVTATDPEPFPMSDTAYSAWVDSAKVNALQADWNGDGITDLWFYDRPSGTWRFNFGTTNWVTWAWPGSPHMEAAPGDYDGDGNEDLGVYDRAYGMWHILFLPRGNEWSGSFFGGTVCETKATPVPADYDGDGATDLALYWMGYWFICYSRTWATLEVEPFGTIFVVEPFAERGMPVMGDWDGDGITEMGVYANGIWTLRLGNGDVVVQEFGGWESGVWPAPGDYDGDGATDLGVHNYIANEWRWRSSWTGFTSTNSFGPCGGRPMQGYFDHDRNEDFAQTFIWAHDFVVWLIKRTDERPDYPYLYQGQSYQLSTDTWLVSW